MIDVVLGVDDRLSVIVEPRLMLLSLASRNMNSAEGHSDFQIREKVDGRGLINEYVIYVITHNYGHLTINR